MADLRNYGAIYDDPSPDTIAQNDRAIAKLIAALPANGGGIDLQPGVLHLSQCISYPQPWFVSGASDFRPLNFYVHGTSSSRIKRIGGTGPLIVIAPNYAANYPGGYARLKLDDVTLDGGGLQLIGGGKYTIVRDVNVVNAEIGFDVQHCDGGALHGLCNAFSCQMGAKFSNAMHFQFDRFICRDNQIGLVSENGGAWSGAIYCESNHGLQADFHLQSRSNLAVWFEDRTGGGNRPLVRRRECTHNVWSGVVQNEAWDDDQISRLLNRTVTDESEWRPIGEPVGAATIFVAYSGAPLFSQDGLTIVCKPGCLAQPMNQGEVRGFDPAFAYEWKAGDYFEIDADIKTSPQTRAFCGGEAVFMFGMAAGNPSTKINVKLTGETTHVRAIGKANTDGKSLRLFVTILLHRNNPEELRFELSNVQVRHLKGTP